ncbi:MAG: helix-turn-helix domain-containing protein [Thermomicrobiales bacterium]
MSKALRFSELKREIDGVSQRVLTATLRQLVRDGFVRRTVTPFVPPRVDYALTPLGESLHDAMQFFVNWTEMHQEDISTARVTYDARCDEALLVEDR